MHTDLEGGDAHPRAGTPHPASRFPSEEKTPRRSPVKAQPEAYYHTGFLSRVGRTDNSPAYGGRLTPPSNIPVRSPPTLVLADASIDGSVLGSAPRTRRRTTPLHDKSRPGRTHCLGRVSTPLRPLTPGRLPSGPPANHEGYRHDHHRDGRARRASPTLSPSCEHLQSVSPKELEVLAPAQPTVALFT